MPSTNIQTSVDPTIVIYAAIESNTITLIEHRMRDENEIRSNESKDQRMAHSVAVAMESRVGRVGRGRERERPWTRSDLVASRSTTCPLSVSR